MKAKISTKLSEPNINFLKKLAINRIKADMEETIVSPSAALEVIVNYFKNNHDRYLEMIQTEVNNGYK